jgi:hypothetical protein
MIFFGHIIDSMRDLLTVAWPVLAGLLVRNVGLVAVLALIWAMIVEAIVARTAEQDGFVVDHAAVFLARAFACVLVAGGVWCIVTLFRKRATALPPPEPESAKPPETQPDT